MIGPNDLLSKEFIAGAAIGACKFVKMGSNNGEVIEAVDGAATIVGVSPDEATASGARIRVQQKGIAKVKSGGTITRGAYVTASTAGVAVAAAPASGVNSHVGGYAEESAASGDLFGVVLGAFVMQGQ